MTQINDWVLTSSPHAGGRRCEFSVAVYYYDGEKIKDINCVFDFSPTGRQTELKWKRKRANYPSAPLGLWIFSRVKINHLSLHVSLFYEVSLVWSLFQLLIGSWVPV